MKRSLFALVLALTATVAWADTPSTAEVKGAAKTGATGAVNGGKQAAQEIAKDPGTAKKHVRSSLKRLFRGAAQGAVKAVAEKHGAAPAQPAGDPAHAPEPAR